MKLRDRVNAIGQRLTILDNREGGVGHYTHAYNRNYTYQCLFYKGERVSPHLKTADFIHFLDQLIAKTGRR